jgi:tRNA-dependent cyclodipeptide synthase
MKHIDYQILDAVEASIYWKDLDGRYLGCNKYMEDMVGLSREEIIGQTDYFLSWKNEANKLREVDQLVTTDGKRYEFEEVVKTANGTQIFLSSKSPLFNNAGKVIGIVGVSVDVTNNKKFKLEFEKTEQALDEYLKIKKRFLQNISHEARIPLNSVVSIIESLYLDWERHNNEEKKKNIDLVYKESQRLSQFILNTFDMSNFVKGQIQPNFGKYNLSELIKNIVSKHKSSFKTQKTEIKLNNFDEYTLVFDQKLITQVLENLLMNAMQYSPNKKIITIDLHKSHLKNGTVPAVHCCIIDEGMGIPEAELQSIFDSFTESSMTASKACGIGLGLSICKEIIELHSGEIWAENNNLRSGATFNFCIPTILFAFSNSKNILEEESNSIESNIVYRDLSKIYSQTSKKPFAIIAASPFNSYFSSDKIFEICEWVSKYYEDFAIFFPDKISRYNLEAIGYDESKIHQKVIKQDNHTWNRINNALNRFYEKYPDREKIIIHTISTLKENHSYQELYKNYLSMFYNNKDFRTSCHIMVQSYLENNFRKKGIVLNDFQNATAIYMASQYLLFELPAMINMADILNVKSCDYVYHDISLFLKQLAAEETIMPVNQGFLVLK